MIIIQSRLNSKRLPGKALKKINNIELIKRVYLRIKNFKKFKKILVAIPDNRSNLKLKTFLKKNKIPFFLGSEKNVFSRFYNCLKKYDLKYIIRISGDSPLIDPKIIDKILKLKEKSKNFDLITNIFPRSYPVGQSVELIPKSTFEKLKKIELNPEHKEHVTKYIYENNNMFKIINMKNIENQSSIRLVVDTRNDLKLIDNLIRIKNISLSDNYNTIIKYIKTHTNKINKKK